MRFFAFLILLILPHMSYAADLKYTEFAKLPVQHEGRIKPIDTFARSMLSRMSGHQSVENMSADAWLAETLFDPATALRRPVFRIFRPNIIGLSERDSKFYSFAELAPALQARAALIEKLADITDQNRSADQRELMRVSDAALLYTQLLRSFSFALPLNIELPPVLAKEWKLKEKRLLTLQDYRQYEPRLTKRIKAIVHAKGDDPARYTAEEREIAQLGMDLHILEQAAEGNDLFRIIPGAQGKDWFSPWALTQAGQGSPASSTYLNHWQDMAVAYQKQDGAAWDAAIKNAAPKTNTPLLLEIAYNKIKPLTLASFFYLAAFLGVVFYSLRGRFLYLSFAALALGGLLHTGAVVARIVILERAPVGTLYESVVFVSLICVIVALVLEKIRKDGQGILIGSLAGLILLFIAGSFAEDDTMKMLTAVLNTNFWLSTHVLCITMGYGWCLIVSLLAHIWLIKKALQKECGDLISPIKILSLVALLFTAVGTILGGIWADQSWGRFWGWDPKENGALLIVLWLIWILHGHIGGQLKRPAFMAGMAALSIVVALAWFGVNLLSVGLHSYGFITGVAASLGMFCVAEMLLIGFLMYRAERPLA